MSFDSISILLLTLLFACATQYVSSTTTATPTAISNCSAFNDTCDQCVKHSYTNIADHSLVICYYCGTSCLQLNYTNVLDIPCAASSLYFGQCSITALWIYILAGAAILGCGCGYLCCCLGICCCCIKYTLCSSKRTNTELEENRQLITNQKQQERAERKAKSDQIVAKYDLV